MLKKNKVYQDKFGKSQQKLILGKYARHLNSKLATTQTYEEESNLTIFEQTKVEPKKINLRNSRKKLISKK